MSAQQQQYVPFSIIVPDDHVSPRQMSTADLSAFLGFVQPLAPSRAPPAQPVTEIDDFAQQHQPIFDMEDI